MDVREKLVELLWEYDQMRMMRMSIEECANRLILKGLTVTKCEKDTKCSDFAICLDENEKEKTERIVDLMTSFYGVDPGYYGVEAYPLASHLIAHGVTVQEWISVKDRLPEVVSTHKRYRSTVKKSVRVLCVCVQKSGKTMVKEGYCEWYNDYPEPRWLIPGTIDEVTHWMPLPEPPKGDLK